ncbi:MAG: hypothetical protein Q9191_004364 [Dirinaria sp. TL-2023a]
MCPGVPEWSAKKGEYRYKHGCASDFDYRGWYIYASRREALNSERGIEQRGCSSNCYHPSECRWNSEQLATRAKKYDQRKRAAKHGDKLSGSTNPSNGLPGTPPKKKSLDQLDLESQRSGQDLTTSGTDPPAPESRIDSLEPTVTFAVRAEATPEAARQSSAERRAKRKTKRHRNITAPLLSPIKEEMRSPDPPKLDNKVRRPALRFTTHLDGFLNPYHNDTTQIMKPLDRDEDDIMQTLDIVDDIDMLPQLSRTGSKTPNDRVSRPAMLFTTHFVDFLESQNRPCVLPEIEPLDDLPDFEKMDLDGPPEPPTQPSGTLVHSDTSRQNSEDEFMFNGSGSSSMEHEEEEEFPLSPTRSAWEWTAGGIGMAVSTPAEAVGKQMLGEEMEVEYNVW